MLPVILPLKAVLLQSLLLLVTIAIESSIFHRRLNLPRQLSIVYAASINLISISISWFFFFCIQPGFLPIFLKTQLVSYIVLGKLSSTAAQSIDFWMIVIGFAIFFITLQVKAQGLYLLQITGFVPSRMVQKDRLIPRHRRMLIQREQIIAILGAHGISHSAMLIILVILNLQTIL